MSRSRSRKLTAPALLLALLACAPGSHAADSRGNFAVWGVGARSCHAFNELQKTGETEKYRDYVMGYLTAYNYLAEETYKIGSGMDLDQIMTWLADYCALKPINGFEQALSDFTVEHAEQRLRHAPNQPGH